MDALFFQTSPEVVIGTNTFIDVPTILQWEDVPLLQVGQFFEAGFTTKIAVYHSDGTRIGYVKGSQIYINEEGRKAEVNLRTETGLTACELEGKTIFELRRSNPGQLKGWAELYAPEGVLIKATDSQVSAALGNGSALPVLNAIRNGKFEGHEIAIHITKANGVNFGGRGGKGMQFETGSFVARATGGGKIGFLTGDSVALKPVPGGEAFVNTTTAGGHKTVRGAIGRPVSDPPPPAGSDNH